MKKTFAAVLVYGVIASQTAFAGAQLDFTFHKLESGQPGNTLLVIGGISGDEPGGFNAASLLVTHYQIKKGSVWVVPNLNFISIIQRLRGVYGDLNRKFATIQSTDPEYETIKKIKAIILEDQVDLVLNLHDGSGFYNPRYIDRGQNPGRWGQSVIIDQERIETDRFGNLGETASQVAAEVNRHLFSEKHAFHVKNTVTRFGNAEMEKSLTYFAISNLKPAFGLEASKTFPTHKRAYYHLHLLESFMDLLGIDYERNFELSAYGVEDAINNNVRLALYGNKILLDVANARNLLSFIPLKKAAEIDYRPSNPLIALTRSGRCYKVHHGNRRLTRLDPEYFEYDFSIDSMTLQIDGNEKKVYFGEMVGIGESFLVKPENGYRVNVIGYKKPGIRNEAGVSIHRKRMAKRFSVDKAGTIYRVEVYHERKFSGMILVNFRGKSQDLLALTPPRTSPLSLVD